MNFEQAAVIWREGERRLAEAEPRLRAAMERVVDEIVDALRRRLGGPFLADELAELYVREGTDWCYEVAMRAAPGEPEAWDLTTVAGAAFARYVRQASDFAGGRRADPDAE